MVESNGDTKLAAAYEAIRRRECILINDLLEVFPKIDNLGDERIGQVRDALFHADHPFLMVFVGPFSSGKSSIINALVGSDRLLRIGATPTTDRINILRWGDEPGQMDSGGDVNTVFYPSALLQKVSFVDTPGLESVFERHEETTRKFLHRSDVVLLVMLATQAMTASNLAYLQQLKDYGKKIILVVNQIDLISPEERETVRRYVQEQSQDKLGFTPEIWLVSARLGLEARSEGELDPVTWRASGLDQVESYIDRSLSDADRMRQKLQTPLQILQNAHKAALSVVRANQATLDHYQSINENVAQQLAAQQREQEKIVRDFNSDIAGKFVSAAQQGGEAIHDIFQLSRALGSLRRGFTFSLARLIRRGDHISYVKKTFDQHKVFEPIDELPDVFEKLGPRLEGNDMRDLDNLIQYGRKEIGALPQEMRDKVIGTVQAPVKYDRSMLQKSREVLEQIENEARQVETDAMEQTVRTTLFYFLLWEVLMAILIIALLQVWPALSGDQSSLPIVALIILAALALLGFLALPLRGRFLATNYANRLFKLQNRYTEEVAEAATKQIEYGMQLRRDTVAPLTRLIEAQTQIQNDQLARLQSAEQTMVGIESELASLGKRKFFGIGGS